MQFKDNISVISGQVFLLKRLRYKVKNQLRKAPQLCRLAAVIKASKFIHKTPQKISLQEIRAKKYQYRNFLEAAESLKQKCEQLGYQTEQFLRSNYLINVSVIVLGCLARIHSESEKMCVKLRALSRCHQDLLKKQSK